MNGRCNPQRPATLLLGGPRSGERVMLAFTPDFPCGVEMSSDFTTVVAPLSRITIYNGCVGESCPGDLVLISSHVQSIESTRGGAIRPLAMDDCGASVARTQPRVKLEVQHCGTATRLIVDADSQVVVPAGEVVISALVPGPSPDDTDFAFGRWQEYGTETIPAETPWVDTRIEVRACPLRGCCPCGQLTENIFGLAGSTTAQRTLLRPRGARRLAVTGAVAGAAAAVNFQYLRDLATAFGAEAVNPASRAWVELFGDSQGLLISNTDDAAIQLRWEICGP